MTTDQLAGPLYDALTYFLPAYVDNPFSKQPKLCVREIHLEIGMSYEGVYKWLRCGKLSKNGASRLIDLGNRENNISALTTLGRNPPEINDFAKFLIA